MGYFSFPHTRTYNSDLGWLIKKMVDVDQKLSEYLENAVITFADPIGWNITEQYTALTMVVDSDGTAYLSRQPVPAGVDISNTDYWMPVFNYDDNINKLRATIAANEQTSDTATAPRSVGDLVYLDGVLYKVTANMAIGTRYIAGSNCEVYTVSDRIRDIVTEITVETAARESADNTLQANIDAETAARESADNTLQANIDAETAARESADNTLQNNIAAETAARQDADTIFTNQIAALNTLIEDTKNFDIRNYGGVADGVTDNTAAFNACMAAHNVVYFPCEIGQYYQFNSPITLTTGQTIIGSNGANLRFNVSTSAIKISGTCISVKGITILMQNPNIVFDRISTGEFVIIDSVTTVNAAGFYTDANCPTIYTLTYFKNCTGRQMKGAGFTIRKSYAFLFMSYCTIDNAGSGTSPTWRCYDFYDCRGMHLSHCEAEAGYTDGSHPTQGGFVFSRSVAIWIDNCFADYQDGSGFYFDTCEYIYMTNSGSSLVGGYGIFIAGNYSMLSNIYAGTQDSGVGVRYFDGGVCHTANNVIFNSPSPLLGSGAAIVNGGALMRGTMTATAPTFYKNILSGSTLITNVA